MRKSTTPRLADCLIALVEAADFLARPTLRKAFAGDGAWEEGNRLRNQVQYAERRGLLQREERAAALVYRLTESGRLSALGGRDPEERWDRPWDGRWRLILFDLPAHKRGVRRRLLRWLHREHFGFLQNSVWVSPDPVVDLAEVLTEYHDDMEALAMMESQCVAGYSAAAVVRASWDFAEINKRYNAYLQGFGKLKALAIASDGGTWAWATHWLRAERVAWNHAVGLDPLLPRALLPPGYRGMAAWRARRQWVRALLTALDHGPTGC